MWYVAGGSDVRVTRGCAGKQLNADFCEVVYKANNGRFAPIAKSFEQRDIWRLVR
jgi:hypothetical protein